MKSSITIAAIAIMASGVVAAPAIDYTPKGGWGSVDYSHVDYSKVDWSKVRILRHLLLFPTYIRLWVPELCIYGTDHSSSRSCKAV